MDVLSHQKSLCDIMEKVLMIIIIVACAYWLDLILPQNFIQAFNGSTECM